MDCKRPRVVRDAVHVGWKAKSLRSSRRLAGDDEETSDDRALIMAHWR
ncbi:hypothetical protein V6Z11_A06G202000 [Gossypium hirsutum]